MVHGLCLLQFFPSAACTDEQKETMLASVYLATMECYHSGDGPQAQMMPVRITELNHTGRDNFVPRVYAKRSGINGPDCGFGFGFHEKPNGYGSHLCRIMVVDLSKWTLPHVIHFMGKFKFFVDQTLCTHFYIILYLNFYS